MSTPPFVRFYGNDWFTGCAGLKADERGVYISMCVFIWTIGRRVPLDDADAARMMGFHFANYQRIRDRLVVKGKVQQHADGYGVKRAEKELDIARNRMASEPTTGNGRRLDQDAPGRVTDGAAEADRVRQTAGSDAEIGRALLGDHAVDYRVDPIVHTTVDPIVKVKKTQCFLRATKEPEPDNKKEPPTPSRGPTPLEALSAFEAWNVTAGRCALAQAAKLTPDRQRKIIARLKDYGTDGWSRALANIEKSSFLTGKNDRGWRANLDFLIAPASFSRVHDGTYGNGRHAETFKPADLKPHEIELQREADELKRMGLI